MKRLDAANDNDAGKQIAHTRKIWQTRMGRDLTDKDARQILHSVTGFFGGEPGDMLMVGEGIETCLAAMQATGKPAWAALSTSGLRSLDLPRALPPLAEQHRIVAKVDAVMALCDRLEASLTAAAVTRRRLLDALLAEALAPPDARDVFVDAARRAKPVPTFAGDASEAAE